MVSLRFKLRMLHDFPLFRQKREATGCFLFRRRTEEEEEKISLGQLQSLQRGAKGGRGGGGGGGRFGAVTGPN